MEKIITHVPLPIWMRDCKFDSRGYPIPYFSLIDKEGKAHLSIVDDLKRQRAFKEDLCHICGRKLLRFRASVGGPVTAFHPHAAFTDGPMHRECAMYALQVCPFMAAPTYSKRIDDRGVDPTKLDQHKVVRDASHIAARPDLFVLCIHVGQEYILNRFGTRIDYCMPRKPYKEVEYWQLGKRIDDTKGEALSKEIILKRHVKVVREKMENQNGTERNEP